MGLIAYQYDTGQQVFVLQDCGTDGTIRIRSGTVLRVRAESIASGVEIFYDVHLVDGGTGTFEFVEDDVFADKTSALAEYEVRIGL